MFPYISSTFYFICFCLFPLQAGELGLLAAIPVCVLVMYQTLLIVHLHVTLFLPEASMLNTEQCIIKTHTITPAFHRLIPAGFFFFFFCWSSYSFSIKSGFAPRCSWNSQLLSATNCWQKRQKSVKTLQPKFSSWCHQFHLVSHTTLNFDIQYVPNSGQSHNLNSYEVVCYSCLNFSSVLFLGHFFLIQVSFISAACILIWSTRQRYASLQKLSTLLDKNLDADEVAGNELHVCVYVS